MPNPLTGDPKAYNPETDFHGTLTGTCLCGSITVTITDPELFSERRGHLCHCSNCRKVAGNVYGANLIIEADKVSITDRDGTLKSYQDFATGSGKPVTRFFCGVDGNPVKSETPNYEGKVILKMGLFPRIPAPVSYGLDIDLVFHRPWFGPLRLGTCRGCQHRTGLRRLFVSIFRLEVAPNSTNLG